MIKSQMEGQLVKKMKNFNTLEGRADIREVAGEV